MHSRPSRRARSSQLARLARLSLLAALAALSACKRQHDEAPCSAVANRVLAIAQAETQAAKVDEAQRQRAALQLPALRDSADASCALGNWTLEMRRCMTAAADGAALQACQRHLSDEQRAALARAAAVTSPEGH